MAGPLHLLRERWRRWWQGRLPRTDTLALTQRNVYILPTRPGLFLAATLLVLLVASINYQLNLGYGLTFLLAGSALAAMHVAHATLRGLRLALALPQPAFAGSGATAAITLSNPGRRARHAVGLAVLEDGQESRWAWCDVPAGGQATVHLALRPARRGRLPLPLLTAETRFPLGIFRVWALWRPAASLLVYPAPEPHAPPLPAGEPQGGAAVAVRGAPSGDFDGLRPWRAGDPMQRIAWKKVASSGELVTREALASQRRELWLDLAQAGGDGVGDIERRLSRLAAWVLQADRLGLAYGLRLPGARIAPGMGDAHRRQCLEALALWSAP